MLNARDKEARETNELHLRQRKAVFEKYNDGPFSAQLLIDEVKIFEGQRENVGKFIQRSLQKGEVVLRQDVGKGMFTFRTEIVAMFQREAVRAEAAVSATPIPLARLHAVPPPPAAEEPPEEPATPAEEPAEDPTPEPEPEPIPVPHNAQDEIGEFQTRISDLEAQVAQLEEVNRTNDDVVAARDRIIEEQRGRITDFSAQVRDLRQQVASLTRATTALVTAETDLMTAKTKIKALQESCRTDGAQRLWEEFKEKPNCAAIIEALETQIAKPKKKLPAKVRAAWDILQDYPAELWSEIIALAKGGLN